MYSMKKVAFIIGGLALFAFGFYMFWSAWQLGYYERILSADYFVYGIISDIIGIVLLWKGFTVKTPKIISLH